VSSSTGSSGDLDLAGLDVALVEVDLVQACGGKSSLSGVEASLLRKVGNVFEEYLKDCDFDLEGCSGEELQEIERAIRAAREIRRRIVAHVAGEADARGRPLDAVAGVADRELGA